MIERVLIKGKSTTASHSLRRGFVITLITVICLSAIYAHISLASASDDSTSRLMILDRIFDLLLVAGLGGLTFCIGRAISQALSLDFANISEELAFSIMLGTGTLALSLLGIGLVGLLKPLPIAILMILLVGLTRRQASRLSEALKEGVRATTATRTRWIIALSFCVLAGLMVVRTATPPHNFDEAIYHLSVSKLFAEQGRVYPVYDNLAGNMPFLIQMIYVFCLIVKADIAAKLFSLFLALITALALYGFCARFLTRRTGVVAMFAFFGSGMAVEVAVTARIDISLSGMLFLAAYAMMVYFETKQRGWLYLSAMLSGFGLGIKHTAGIWLLLIGAMFLVESFLRKRESLLGVIKQGLLYVAIVVALVSPWYLKNLVWFHNPLYPFITGEVAEVGRERLRYFNAEDERKLDAYLDETRREIPEVVEAQERVLAHSASLTVERHPLKFWEYFTKPVVYSTPAESYHDPNYLFLIVPLMLFLDRRRWLIWLAVFSVMFFLMVTYISWIARYLLPIYPALTVLAAYTLTGLADKLRPRTRIADMLPAIGLLITVGATAFVSASQLYKMQGMEFVGGSLSRRDFMRAMFYYPSIEFINHNLPQDAGVMMIGAQMSYDLQRNYIADVSWDTTEWRRLLISNGSLDEAHQDLKKRGITHILFSPGLFQYSAMIGTGVSTDGRTAAKARPGYYVQLRNWATVELFRQKFLEPIYADQGGYYVYKIK